MAREDKNSGNAENNAPSDFLHDPVVDEIIAMFVHLDIVILFLIKHANLPESSKKLNKAFLIGKLRKDKVFSSEFRIVATKEFYRLLVEETQKLPSKNIILDDVGNISPDLLSLFHGREKWIIPEIKIANYLLNLPMMGQIAYLVPIGRSADWCFNILICVLAEYCKRHYPKQKNYFALIASKLRRLSTKKPSWKKERKKVADLFAIMKKKYDTKSIYDVVMNILLP